MHIYTYISQWVSQENGYYRILNSWHNFKIFVNILENDENYTHKHADLLHVLHFPDHFRLMFLASFGLHFSGFFGCICFKKSLFLAILGFVRNIFSFQWTKS